MQSLYLTQQNAKLQVIRKVDRLMGQIHFKTSLPPDCCYFGMIFHGDVLNITFRQLEQQTAYRFHHMVKKFGAVQVRTDADTG